MFGPFSYRTLKYTVFKCFRNFNVRYSDPHCILFPQHKVKPFHGARILFHGFTDDERQHMVSELVRNGGVECTQMGDTKCTHVVVDDANVTSLPQGLVAPNADVPVVKSEWFWASIQVTEYVAAKVQLVAREINLKWLQLKYKVSSQWFYPGYKIKNGMLCHALVLLGCCKYL